MDSETRQKAEEKVKAVRNMIGYPDFIMDSVLLDRHYENVSTQWSGGLVRNGGLVRSGGLVRNGGLVRSGGLVRNGGLVRSGGLVLAANKNVVDFLYDYKIFLVQASAS